MLTTMRVRLQGDDLDPDNVTRILKVTPHLECKIGNVLPSASGDGRPERTSRWEWYSRDDSKGLSIDEHIAKFAAVFGESIDQFCNISDMKNGWVDISLICISPTKDTQVSFVLNSASIGVLGRMGMPVEFSCYVLSEESEGG